jgi:hypothetical protein
MAPDSEQATIPDDPERLPGELATGSKANGNQAERWVQEEYGLNGQDADLCPEYAHDAVDPRTGTPIEVKSCQIYYNGDGSRGRFQIWDYAHETLLEHGGGYVFVVHEPRTEEFHVYFHRPLSAEAVDGLIGNWHAIDHSLRPSEAHRTSLAQSAVFTDIGISRIEPTSSGGEETEEDTASQHETVNEIIEAIREVAEQHDSDAAPHGAVVQRVVESTGRDPEAVEHQIQELRKRGEIYSPEEGKHRVTSDI